MFVMVYGVVNPRSGRGNPAPTFIIRAWSNSIRKPITADPSACRDMITSSPLGDSQAGGYFVTIVTWQRQFLFGKIVNNEMELSLYGEIVQRWWYEIISRM
jgi:hypothetical protein